MSIPYSQLKIRLETFEAELSADAKAILNDALQRPDGFIILTTASADIQTYGDLAIALMPRDFSILFSRDRGHSKLFREFGVNTLPAMRCYPDDVSFRLHAPGPLDELKRVQELFTKLLGKSFGGKVVSSIGLN